MSTMAFTGRRPKDLVGYDAAKYDIFLPQLVNYIIMLYNNGVRKFITGGAQGFDQLVFWAVHEAKKTHNRIQSVVYVPFKGQERR